MAEAQRNPAFGESFRSVFLAERRSVMRQLLDHAARRGAVRADADVGFLVELFFGALWYRLLSASGPLDRRFADRITDTLLALARPP
jgi:hypothetical protein